MKRLAVATCTAITLALLASTAAPVHAAQGGQSRRQIGGITMPVTSVATSAIRFVGTLDLNQFVATSTGVLAMGTLTGTLTDASGVVTTVVRNVAIPINITQAACDILHLELGPLDLDLLGLIVHLNQIVLDIDAQPGPGNLLGNLLCGVAGLLDNPGGLTRLLNDLLQILG
jgi:hypothetical protein